MLCILQSAFILIVRGKDMYSWNKRPAKANVLELRNHRWSLHTTSWEPTRAWDCTDLGGGWEDHSVPVPIERKSLGCWNTILDQQRYCCCWNNLCPLLWLQNYKGKKLNSCENGIIIADAEFSLHIHLSRDLVIAL